MFNNDEFAKGFEKAMADYVVETDRISKRFWVMYVTVSVLSMLAIAVCFAVV